MYSVCIYIYIYVYICNNSTTTTTTTTNNNNNSTTTTTNNNNNNNNHNSAFAIYGMDFASVFGLPAACVGFYILLLAGSPIMLPFASGQLAYACIFCLRTRSILWYAIISPECGTMKRHELPGDQV